MEGTPSPAPSTDLPLDGVAVGQGGFEAVHGIRHCVLAPLAMVLEYSLGRQAARQREDERMWS